MSLASVPVGSTIERVYFTTPTSYSRGQEFDSFVAARDAAVQEWLQANERHPEGMVPNRIYVDLRWFITYPSGNVSGIDTVIERTPMPAVRLTSVVESFDLCRGPAAAARARELGLRCVWNEANSSFEIGNAVQAVTFGSPESVGV